MLSLWWTISKRVLFLDKDPEVLKIIVVIQANCVTLLDYVSTPMLQLMVLNCGESAKGPGSCSRQPVPGRRRPLGVCLWLIVVNCSVFVAGPRFLPEQGRRLSRVSVQTNGL